MKLDDCLRIINRRLREARAEVSRRQLQGLQARPWQHRIQELEAIRREIAALSTQEAMRKPETAPMDSRQSATGR